VHETRVSQTRRKAIGALRDGLSLGAFVLALHVGGLAARIALWLAVGWAGILLLAALLALLGLALGVPPPGDDDDDDDDGGGESVVVWE
jgi:hypothetical protein